MSSETTTALRRTPLYDEHVAAGAKLVPFAGWEMPVQYGGGGVKEEHLAVRSAAGVFDVSHMGEIETEGPGALDLLQRLLSNDVSKLALGGAQYSVLCREDGGILDDLFTYRLGDDRYLTVTNAANHERDLAWFEEHAAGFDCEVGDRLEAYAMLAVQGPAAREAAAPLFEGELPARMRTAQLPLAADLTPRTPGGEAEDVAGVVLPGGEAEDVAGVVLPGAEGEDVAGVVPLVCGTGYTGEDGVEILIEPDRAAELWRALLDRGVVPAGLAARDTLRTEVCFHLYGNDLSTDRNAIEAGLGWCCTEETGFIGADAVAAARAGGSAERLAPFEIAGAGIARQGNPVVIGSEPVGEVTSGTFSPSLGRGIGMAYVRADLAEPGTEVEIDVRGRRRSARIESKPLYKPDEPEAKGPDG